MVMVFDGAAAVQWRDGTCTYARCADVAEYVCEAFIDLTPGYRLLFTHQSSPSADNTDDVVYSCWVFPIRHHQLR